MRSKQTADISKLARNLSTRHYVYVRPNHGNVTLSPRIEVNRPQPAASSPGYGGSGWWARVVVALRWGVPYPHICIYALRKSENWSVIYKHGTVVKSTSRLCLGMPQTPRAEVDRPRPAESAAQPAAQVAVGPVACGSYSYPARNAVLTRPYASLCALWRHAPHCRWVFSICNP